MFNLDFIKIKMHSVSKEQFDTIKKEAAKYNTDSCLMVTLISAVISWVSFFLIVLFFENKIQIQNSKLLYFCVAVIMTVAFFHNLYIKNRLKKTLPLGFVYAECLFLTISSAVVGTIYNSNGSAGIYIGVLIVFCVIVIDRFWRVALFAIIINLIFVVLSFKFESLNIAIIDFSNSMVAVIIGLAISKFNIKLKVNREKSKRSSVLQLQQKYKMQIASSQIQPHFIFNALSTIQYLCVQDPQLAAETTNKFAKYLRINMDSLSNDNPIPFEKEIEHLENYLYIEKLRYGDRLNTEFNFETKNFFIPSLTIQPLVENAIRHGIAKCDNGGTIKLHTYKYGKGVRVVVSDNGVGFDVSETNKTNDARSHMGIEIVRKRLMTMCGGTIEINSKKGKGTVVIIELPGKE